MTEREALDAHDDIVNFVANGCYNGKNSLDYSTLIIAMESIGKQIVKRVISSNRCAAYEDDCPSCGRELLWMEVKNFNYCPYCGQAIEWS